MQRSSFSAGFTILEILIVIAVFGLLATFGALSLNSARARARDAQRVSDVSVLRNALSEYWLQNSRYPASASVNLGQPGTKTAVFGSSGFTEQVDPASVTYLPRVPTGPTVNEYYRYHGGVNGYSIRFQTESDTMLGKANVFYAHAAGIDDRDEEK